MSKLEHTLIIAPQPFYEDRGTPIAVRQVLETLSADGRRVDLLTYAIGAKVELPGLHTIRVGKFFGIRDVPIGFSFRKLLLDMALTVRLWRLLSRNRYDCIHAVEEAAFPATFLGKRRRIPVIYDMQSSLPEQMSEFRLCRVKGIQTILRACEKWLVKNADAVVCSAGLGPLVRSIDPSVRVQEWSFYSEWAHVPREDVQTLRRELGIAETAPIVLYCGNFEPYQGVPKFTNALPHVLQEVPDTVFVLVGSNNGSKEIRNGGRLIMMPRQPKEAIPPYLAMADVLVSPRENCSNLPLKIFEYMASGRPIVATDSPCHRTVLHSGLAVLVQPAAEAMAHGIVKILKNPAEAEILGKAAQDYAREKLNHQAFRDAVMAIHTRGAMGRRRERLVQRT
ncbi:MAG: glycosyltransferase [bacterium]|nr:glycosyltransferase [bacterium]